MDAGEATPDTLDKALADQRATEKTIALAEEAVNASRAGVEERRTEIAALWKQIEKARAGG